MVISRLFLIGLFSLISEWGPLFECLMVVYFLCLIRSGVGGGGGVLNLNVLVLRNLLVFAAALTQTLNVALTP